MALLHCSFCGKSQDDLHLLIKGKNGQICDECIVICVQVMSDRMRQKTRGQPDLVAKLNKWQREQGEGASA